MADCREKVRRRGKRWNTKHASTAWAPEGRGGIFYFALYITFLEKFWHCASIISKATLFSSSSSSPPSSPPTSPSPHPWLQSAIYAKTGGVFLSRSLLPGGTSSFLEHIYNFFLSVKKKKKYKIWCFSLCPISLSVLWYTLDVFCILYIVCVWFLSWISPKPFFIFLNLPKLGCIHLCFWRTPFKFQLEFAQCSKNKWTTAGASDFYLFKAQRLIFGVVTV